MYNREIAELHKSNVVKASEAQSAALSVEVQAKEELRLSLERQQHQSRLENEAYISQVGLHYNSTSFLAIPSVMDMYHGQETAIPLSH